jgi:tetratricopeptide (TPR) repeat protein
MVVTLLLAVKQIRLLLVLRRSANSHWAGAVVASVFALLVIFIAGAVGSGVSLAVFEQRVLVRQIYAAESDGRRTEALYRASEFIAARDYDSAIVEYDKAIEADAEFAGSYASRGDAYVQKGDYRAALKDYDEAIRLNPEDWALFTSRCRAQLLAKGPPAEALADCNRALELRPGAPVSLGARAMVHLTRGDFAAALADYEAVLAAQPDSVQALYGRGVALHNLGKVRDGERDMAAAVARAPAVAAPFAALGFDPLREGVPANAP